jgi:hypothetical protein
MKFGLLLLLSAVTVADGSVLDFISPEAWTRLRDFSEKNWLQLGPTGIEYAKNC